MKAVVVYESIFGNTAAVARAVAEGLGPDAQALTTDEASDAVVLDAEVIVAGAPVIGFNLANDKTRTGISPGGWVDCRTAAALDPSKQES